MDLPSQASPQGGPAHDEPSTLTSLFDLWSRKGSRKALRVGVAWSTLFDRPGWERIRYRKLPLAYRAPTFFAQGMINGGHSLHFIRFDEELRVGSFNGTTESLSEAVDLLYIATHGYNNGSYRVALHAGDWDPAASGLSGAPSPAGTGFGILLDSAMAPPSEG